MGPLLQSDGSAEWQTGENPRQIRLACSVNGPIEVKLRDELPQQATLELVYRRNMGLPMIRERLIQDRLHTCLLAALSRDQMPRSLVQVVVQLMEAWKPVESSEVRSMEDDAFFAEISEGVNVMSKAVLNAGIPSRGVVAAASYAVLSSGDIVKVIDKPKNSEVQSLHACAYIYKGESEPKLVMCESLGSFSKKELLEVLEQAQTECSEVVNSFRA